MNIRIVLGRVLLCRCIELILVPLLFGKSDVKSMYSDDRVEDVRM